MAGLERDVGHRQFAGMQVGLADRGGERHRRMLLQRLLDHRRVDVVAAADDQVLGAAGQVEVAVLVQVAEVAGVEPAGLEPDVLVVLVAQVTREHVGSAHADHADFGRRALADGIARAVDLPDLICWCGRRRPTCRAGGWR